jgi:polyisoprenoid-binding protein YceI
VALAPIRGTISSARVEFAIRVSQFFEVNPAAQPPSGPKPGPWRRDLPRTWRAALDLPDEAGGDRIPAGTYTLGPDNGTLSLRTRRTGAAAKAGHDLLIHVTSWEATLEVGEDPAATSVALDADGASLRVREGTGGMQALADDDKANIQKTIDDEILKRGAVAFRSTGAAAGPAGLVVRGDLTLHDAAQPVEIHLGVAGGAVVATTVVTQSGWGMKPYSILFGTLKVVDEIEVRLDAALPPAGG